MGSSVQETPQATASHIPYPVAATPHAWPSFPVPVRDVSTTRPYYDLVIVVPSHWSAEAERIVIRDTWWRYFTPESACEICHKYRIKPLFLVGMQGAGGSRDATAALAAE